VLGMSTTGKSKSKPKKKKKTKKPSDRKESKVKANQTVASSSTKPHGSKKKKGSSKAAIRKKEDAAAHDEILAKIQAGTTANSGIVAFRDMTREEKIMFLDKLKHISKGPELAQLQIRLLDQMVSHLKQRRQRVGAQIAQDLEDIKWIDNEMAAIHKKFDPLMASLRKRRDRAEELQTALDNCNKAFAAVSRDTYPCFFLARICGFASILTCLFVCGYMHMFVCRRYSQIQKIESFEQKNRTLV